MTKISELTSIVTAAATDIIAVVQGGVTKQVTVQDYIDEGVLAAPGGGSPCLSDYSDVVVVDAGGNGDYTTLNDALAAVSGASATNRFGIIIFPGFYFISEKQSLIRNGVDLLAAIPGTVFFVPSLPSYTDGMFAIGNNEAMDSVSLISGISLYQDSLNYGAAPSLLFTDSIYRFQVKLLNCSLIADTTTYPVSGSTSVNATSSLIFENCLIYQTSPSATVAAIRVRSQYELRLRNSRLVVSNSGANTTPLRVDTVASGTDIMINHCEMIGGGYSVIAAQAATTFPIIYSSMDASQNANFTNLISTNYNIVDANLATFF